MSLGSDGDRTEVALQQRDRPESLQRPAGRYQQAGSVSDLLRNAPSVQVDVDGKVSLRGSPDVQVLINGKPSPLLGNNIADALQQIPASSVEKIEVITNPSTKFTPEGTAGIINIVLNKETNLGFNGNCDGKRGKSVTLQFQHER